MRLPRLLRSTPATIEAPRDARGTLESRSKQLLDAGEMTARLGVIEQLRALAPDEPRYVEQDRFTRGMLAELDPSWLPPLAPLGGYEPVAGVVLHILKASLPHETTGYTIRTRGVFTAFAAVGYRSVAVTAPGFGPAGAIEDIDGSPVHRLSATPGERPTNAEHVIAFAEGARAVVERERPSVIVAHSGFRGYDTALVALALGRAAGIPCIYEVRGFHEGTWTSDLEREATGEIYRLRRGQEERCMREADAVTTIAESIRGELIERGIDAGHVTVVPNGIDAERFQPAPRDASLATRLGLDGRVGVVGYISNMGQREGMDLLLRATATLRERGRDVACLLVGDGPERSRLEALRDELGLGNAGVITGPVPHADVVSYYGLIDVFVIPRRDDRAARWVTPLKPFEAMALRRPLLVADLPALLEVTDPPSRGLSFPCGDVRALADACAEFLDDPALRETIAVRADAWVRAERTWARNGQRYASVLANLGVRA